MNQRLLAMLVGVAIPTAMWANQTSPQGGEPAKQPEQATGEPAAPVDQAALADVDANEKYIVESVSVKAGFATRFHLSDPLRTEMDQMVGQSLDQGMLDMLRSRIRQELEIPDVKFRVSKGQMPERVTVTFEVGKSEKGFDLDLGRFLYHSKQGWTGEGAAVIRANGNAFSFGLISDGDRMAERYAGIQASFERPFLSRETLMDRVGLRFRFQSYHQQWNRATLALADPNQIYRSRQHFIPEATILLADPLEWSFGVDFARYRIAVPSPVGFAAGARTESSNAVVSTLRYHQRWDSDKTVAYAGTGSRPPVNVGVGKDDSGQTTTKATLSIGDEDEDEDDVNGNPKRYVQELTASYGVRSGTGFLESDRLFTKHQAETEYRVHHGHQDVKVRFLTGKITGSAPLFERFVLGTSQLLRGWNKFDLAPLGGANAIHGSIDYVYHGFLMFYDTGAIWDRQDQKEQKQSLGLGFADGSFQIAVAFPIRSGAANPVFYVGVNF